MEKSSYLVLYKMTIDGGVRPFYALSHTFVLAFLLNIGKVTSSCSNARILDLAHTHVIYKVN